MFTYSTRAISKNSSSRARRGCISAPEGHRDSRQPIFICFILPLVGVEPLRIALRGHLQTFWCMLCDIMSARYTKTLNIAIILEIPPFKIK
jgi:hypothetical protein